jgi:hypothetical protein
MSPTVILELTAEEAKTMLPVLEIQRRDLQQKLKATEAKIEKIQSALNGQQTIPQVIADKTPTGRIKRGEAEKMIYNGLALFGQKGASLHEVSKKTGVSPSSAYRSLKQMEQDGKAQKRGSLWTLVA